MLFWITLKVALRSLSANTMRSILTMLGITIGVASVISMMAIGAGAKANIMGKMSAMGTNLLTIRPGAKWRRGVHSGSRNTLKLGDAQAIIEGIPEARQIAPFVEGSAPLKYYNKNTNCAVNGTSFTYFGIRDFAIEKGRAFTEMETENALRVVVLGPITAEALFDDNDPLGEYIKLKGINFKVVGVLKAKGDAGWYNPDDQAVIPYTTAMKQVYGRKHLGQVIIHLHEGSDFSKVEEDVAVILRKRHGIIPPAFDDFRISNQAERIEMVNSSIRVFSILLGSIASISLLVGGIGVMNIMLVTVTERTREIGVRKAIGARDKDILRQFLFEAIILSFLGGAIGIFLGCAVAEILSSYTDFKTLIEPYSIVLAVFVSTFVGIFFGYYPARNASKLDPIDALRYE